MRLLLVVCALLCSLASIAQVSVGHRVGVAWTKWVVASEDPSFAKIWNNEMEFMPGAMLEVPVQFDISKVARISTGIIFIQKGYQWNSGDQLHRQQYLQLPITFGGAVHFGKFYLHSSVGAAFGVNARGEYRTKAFGSTGPQITAIGSEDDRGYSFITPAVEWSGLARVLFGIQRPNSAFEFGFNYQHGLSNVMYDIDMVDQNGTVVYDATATQRSFQLQFGYHLNLTRGREHHMRKTTADSSETMRSFQKKVPRVRIGQRFGGVSSSIDFHGSLPEENTRVNEGAEQLLAMATAVVFDVRLGDHLSLQPELAYTQKGWRCQWYARPTTENDLLRMNYAELPVLLKYSIGNHTWRPFLTAGPVLARGLGGVDVYGSAGTWNGSYFAAVPVTFGDDNRIQYAPWDLAASMGAGIAARIGDGELFLDLRYQHGFIDFVPEGNFSLYSETAEAYHRNWLLNIGYLVPWRK